MNKDKSLDRIKPWQTLKNVSKVFSRYFPLTLQGAATAVVGVTALGIYGYGNLDLVVFALAVCALAILACSFLLSLGSGLYIQRRLSQAQDQGNSNSLASTSSKHLESHYPNETGFSLPSFGHLPLVTLKWQILSPDYLESRLKINREPLPSEWVVNNSSKDSGGANAALSSTSAATLVEEVVPTQRCHSTNIERLFCVEDVLGLCRYRWLHRETQSLTVLPSCNTIKSLPLLRSLTSEDGISDPYGEPHGDRMEIRPYVPGDSVRNILWKSYARNRQLNVRLPEKSVHHSNRTLAYLISGKQDEAAAAVARVAIESGALGEDWGFGADGPANRDTSAEACETVSEALMAIAASRPLPPTRQHFWQAKEASANPYGLDNFLQQDRQSHHGISHCIVFASANGLKDDWPQQLNATIANYSGHISVVLATDGFAESQKDGWWNQLLFSKASQQTQHGPTDGYSSHEQIQQLLTSFGQRVESLMIVDRSTGLCFDQQLKRLS